MTFFALTTKEITLKNKYLSWEVNALSLIYEFIYLPLYIKAMRQQKKQKRGKLMNNIIHQTIKGENITGK